MIYRHGKSAVVFLTPLIPDLLPVLAQSGPHPGMPIYVTCGGLGHIKILILPSDRH